ncbi:glycosyltransferase family 2 protein [Mucilaginibacter sp. Bleaf8]|uniref:glycosyltransferase family 2 protein n=1 Tax=Mucilaginibacter sp. Bleaf8 TaxID=2834430 RepID=UPI001BCD5445|nr:glycosyltransferase family 2 protein [Mucilaginibacter sp. Bleaf8]MBS7562845.1 glycosyltransferase family 2 protein [Mucilaginibacter sp. Bleaf8]
MFQVSVVVPTFNRGNLLIECIDSIIQQTYPNWECMVVDDHSTENIEALVTGITEKEPRVKYFKNAHKKGAQGARNTGLDNALGDYVIYVDSDDLISHECLEKRIRFAQANPGKYFYVFPTGVFVKKAFDTPYVWNYLNKSKDDLVRFFSIDAPWHTSGTLWNKDFLKQIGGWDEDLRRWQDWDTHIRAILNANNNYLKVADKKENIDSFYRRDPDNSGISSTETENTSVEEKITAVMKFMPVVIELNNKQLTFGMAKLIFNLSTYMVERDRSKAAAFLQENLEKLKFSKNFIKAWSFFLLYRYNLAYSRVLRKLLAMSYSTLYAQNALHNLQSTHLNVQYQN